MSQNSRKHRGFRTERVVASYLSQWWENATVGRGYGRDILGVPFDCEVKARAALDAAREMDAMRQIEMPEGVFYKGKTTAPAWAIIQQHHLDFWLPQDEEDYFNEDAGFENGLGLE